MAKRFKEIIQGISIISTGSLFLKSEFFGKNGPVNIRMNDNFREWVLPEVPEIVPEFRGFFCKSMLIECAYDSELCPKIGEGTFTPPEFVGMISRLFVWQQPKGEDGLLLNSGYANIFYLVLKDGRVVTVNVDWNFNPREWDLFAWDFATGCRWRVGRAVFYSQPTLLLRFNF
ncbi:hypothetical protein COY65_02605 [Candidatus Jorgensenbacteria bacterium CG_4_10_14_0_8_um_filter_39_13]|uniref:Uncharacterized protein n=2 Tax=Candidatus Joergenseniibacteriota TaxID=1752739 RepID=A0A2M7RGL6_9BACT|nr:MAG: hypothetical protein COV54_02860 [Candidatus Jorgensenbacteria bacterium CG11_big_fil_rev_8_21_14_0_20_38_23]PIV13141.1 MAG: hypothetical protein COS46_02015 [Candidatus Jorgensenbacteria bacterium CG03_land_8_20_14_0_80_38_39]PIY95697.1 MAG: hypothetical protein COY65_02605 [Candidatus Jorgensenbacteria bacterium CG_4_10_14_0_8_um_filter_39_13]